MIRLDNVFLNYPDYSNSGRYLRNLIFTFKKKKIYHFEILKNISLTIKKGDRIGIIGNNGSGKTTLLKVLSGLLPITAGSIYFEDKILSILNINSGLDDYLSARDNIITLNLINNLKENLDKYDIENILDFAELKKYENQPLKTFSSGMKLRLSFSVLTYIKPKCLILDEWLSVGDTNFKEKSINRLNEIISSSEIFVIASHDNDLIKRLCNKIIKIEDGKIINTYENL